MMDLVLGSLITILSIVSITVANNFFNSKPKSLIPKVSQSRTFAILSPNIIMTVNRRKERPSQSLNHFNSIKVKILMTETKAYWIKNNAVYVAEIENGIILDETAKVVDMMAMDRVQLDEMMFIIEKLTEGKSNDRWDSGN